MAALLWGRTNPSQAPWLPVKVDIYACIYLFDVLDLALNEKVRACVCEQTRRDMVLTDYDRMFRLFVVSIYDLVAAFKPVILGFKL